MNEIPKPEALFPPDVLEQLKIALDEVGDIKPWYDEEVTAWVFEHPLYPESYAGETPEEVIQGYPLYLGKLIQARMAGKLSPWVEKKTTGRGGQRPGAGRPKGTTRKDPTRTIRLPVNIADWLSKDPENLKKVQDLINKYG